MIFGKTVLMETPSEVTDTHYVYRDGKVVSKFHFIKTTTELSTTTLLYQRKGNV